MSNIPFNKPYMGRRELNCIRQAHAFGHISGDGPFTKKCEDWLRKTTGSRRVFLSHSCTAALEMSAILCGIKPGDEVIMPSFAFVSTANAFVLRGAKPVFVDIRPDTLNIDENKIEEAVTKKTKAVVALHYGGISCEMSAIKKIADKHNLTLIEDAAQGVCASYKGQALGSMGDFGAYSFHETKSLVSGEGGALLVKNKNFIEKAEIIREMGTDRFRFLRGETKRYVWHGLGSSYAPSDILAAFLWAQLSDADQIIKKRMKLWNSYHRAFEDLEKMKKARRPVVPADCKHNAHLYYLLLKNKKIRDGFIRRMIQRGIMVTFHYIPLHSSPGGRKFGRCGGNLENTLDVSNRLVRLPLWIGMENKLNQVVDETIRLLR